MFRLLNKTYFNDELERPVIAILTDTTSGAYGWISVNKVWSSKDHAWFREINLCAEHLNRPVELVITTLQHEMCHLWNIQHEIQDTSRGGTYHNQRFKEVAETSGLLVEKDSRYGYCITKPSPIFTELVKKSCRAGCFKLERAKTYRDGTPKVTKTGADGREKTVTRTKQSSRKYVCSQCGVIVRATKEVNIICGDCGATMETIEN
jgi:DNA-directed RNA polymerase subunit RPC12/RpoP